MPHEPNQPPSGFCATCSQLTARLMVRLHSHVKTFLLGYKKRERHVLDVCGPIFWVVLSVDRQRRDDRRCALRIRVLDHDIPCVRHGSSFRDVPRIKENHKPKTSAGFSHSSHADPRMSS